jgi:outer membrane scaffolding protein for murein synthesis (MipA/OmpV family)
MTFKNLFFASSLIIATFGVASQAHAQSSSSQPLPSKPQSQSSTAGTGYIGAAVLLTSEYIGSANEEILPIPYLSFENVKGFDLFGPVLSYRAIEAGTGQGLGKWSLRAGPRLSYQGGRDADDSPNLAGFEDIDGSIMAGGYVRSTIGPLGILLDLSKDVAGGHGGVVGSASIGTAYVTRKMGIQPSLSVNWGDNEFHDSFFSVTSSQAASSPLTAYDASSGIYSYSASLVSWVIVKDDYALSLIGSYSWYINDAEESPILNADDGAKTGLFGAVSVSRRFDTKKW